MMEVISFILQQKMAPTSKLLLLYMVLNEGKKLTVRDLCSEITMEIVNLDNALTNLAKSNIITMVKNKITFSYKEVSYTIFLKELTAKAILERKAKTTVTQAREKLDNLRLSGFVGSERLIYNLSLEYDKLFLQYSGKSRMSLSPVPYQAKKSRNWENFAKTLNIIQNNKFNPVMYLKAQFEIMTTSKIYGLIYPYVSMISSKWAINNYIHYIKEHISTKTEQSLIKTDEEVIIEILGSSHALVAQFKKSNPELSKLQCVLLLSDNLSPLYLALTKEYLKHLTETQQDLDEDLLRVLRRLNKDVGYKELSKHIYNRLERNTDD